MTLLHLGCAGHHLEGYVNCDLYPGPTVDCVFDLMGPWPFDADSVQGIYASHTLEHLPDHAHFFREAWRVLADHHAMCLRVPYGGHSSAWVDPAHVRPWYPGSFLWLQPGYAVQQNNPQHQAWDAPFVVQMVVARFSRSMRPWLRWWPLRKRWLSTMSTWAEAVEELWAVLVPVKGEQAQRIYAETRPANVVPLAFAMYAHDWYREPIPASGRVQLVNLGQRQVRLLPMGGVA